MSAIPEKRLWTAKELEDGLACGELVLRYSYFMGSPRIQFMYSNYKQKRRSLTDVLFHRDIDTGIAALVAPEDPEWLLFDGPNAARRGRHLAPLQQKAQRSE